MSGKFGFAMDRGGTFTDVYVRRPDGSSRVLKLLSEDPQNYKDAPTEAIRRVLQEETGHQLPRGTPIPTDQIGWIRMGTTVATNALLERKGERTVLLVTKGFKDLLYIGNQSRPKIFDLDIILPDVLYDDVVEVNERVLLKRDDCQLDFNGDEDTGTTEEQVQIRQHVDVKQLEADLLQVRGKGIKSLSVVLLHSYMYPKHEQIVGQIARKLGFENVSLSSDIMPMIKAVPRGYTACADAYLTPKIQEYIASFSSGFKEQLKGVQVLFMQSDGGLCPVQSFCGSRAILSGPAGGVVGVSLTAFDPSTKQPVIGFDMGGTSTDVSRYAGELDHVMETTTAGITIQAPQLDINTVAAGGGSRLFFRNGLFVVGPESAGANPGPVCYRKGGHLAVTDANLVLGRIIPDYFPKIFGPKENEALDYESALKAMKLVTDDANAYMKKQDPNGYKEMSVTDVALGFIDVANEAMCRPIRALTQAKGYDTSHHVLACFGGAGGQHACAIAKSLGMKRVFIHRYAGILSAYGLALADVVHEAQEPSSRVYEKDNSAFFNERIAALSATCRSALEKQGFKSDQITIEPYLHMRYARTDCALMCTAAPITFEDRTTTHGDFKSAFLAAYKREFGFVISERDIVVDDIRVRGIGHSGLREQRTIPKAADADHPPVETTTTCFFKEGRLDTNVYQLSTLNSGHRIKGPAVIIDANSTMLVEPGCLATVTDEGDVSVVIGDDSDAWRIGTQIDPIQLSIFSHRFMSIAEQMGRILQRTSISTNIKERLDFSCALFGPDGGLIANAPHIPVHLGGMQATVRFQIDHLGIDGMCDGDVILCNHPKAGGSHLPDFTVITPVYYQGSTRPVFFTANRGHHADIGGLVPGSMPPHSTDINQEGAAFVSFKLVEAGRFNETALIEQLKAPGKVPGCSGTRNLSDNLSDLRAQVAANTKGISLVCELIDAYGLDVVQAYMGHIQSNAEVAVRTMLKQVGRNARTSAGEAKLHAIDFMDDGTPIELTVEINEETGEATFDFTGTGPEVYGSCNAPQAVTMAAVIYCLRCLVGHEIPLNQGCMAPITVHIPPGTILSAHDSAAVVGGNVQTSQRLCDVILKAFKACAASQGCMNNITFGDDTMGYYETVAGGAGAGPTWNGRSGIHTHMTNTRITDSEIMEKRYPIILRQFGLRANSGGCGKFKGGDGCLRDYEFRKDLTLSILTERRVFAPYGLNGGQDGQKGLNLLRIKAHNGRLVNLGAKTSVPVSAGDIFELRTPGGGGWGKKE